MTQVITNSMPAGIAGDIASSGDFVIEGHVQSSTPVAAFGLPAKFSAGKLTGITTGDDAADVAGFLVRQAPSPIAIANDLGSDVPAAGEHVNLMVRGYMTVKVNAGTAALNGSVFVRVDTAAPSTPIGGVEAVADGANTIELTGAKFMGAATGGLAVVRFNV